MKFLFLVYLILKLTHITYANPNTIVSTPGESQVLQVSSNHPIRVINEKLIKITDQGKTIRVLSKKTGEVQINSGNFNYKLKIIPTDLYKAYQALNKNTSGNQNLNYEIPADEIILRGEILNIEEWQTLHFNLPVGSKYLFCAEVKPELQDQIENELHKILEAHYLPKTNFSFQNCLETHIPKNHEHLSTRYEEVLNSRGVKVIKGTALVDIVPMIQVKITVAELKKSSFQRFGLSWPTSYNASVVPQENWGFRFGSLDFNLHALEANGHGKILATPTLVCRSGEEAEFFAGGEFPIKIANFKMHDVIWKKYGVILKIKPVADQAGQMNLSIDTEISSIDASNTIDGIPGINKNRIQSFINLKKNRTVALSGLIKNETSQSLEGLTGLSRIPILGTLFSSQEYREQKTELVIFVTPQVLDEENMNENFQISGGRYGQ